jgi:NhaA family Na+:H+ antiporter
MVNMPDGQKQTDPHAPGELEQGFANIIRPFQAFIRNQKTGSLLLLATTLIALAIANSPLAEEYHHLISMQIGFLISDQQFSMSLHHWINDGLMALFFFVIGLEIKRELLAGELREPAKSIPVIAAAIGGMLVPAIIFYALNGGTDTVHGWAIPMATDTAFAIGLLALLGKRIPRGLISFILALAIIDDIGAVMVIALFYSTNISQPHLFIAFGLILLLLLGNRLGIRHPVFYFLTGGLVWLMMFGSGVHATLAGILVAMTVPARPASSSRGFLKNSIRLLRRFREIELAKVDPSSVLEEPEKHELAESLHKTVKDATTPLQRWEQRLEHPVALLVLPVFALVNAGIALSASTLSTAFTSSLSLGIILGLVAGKFIGISSFTWLVLKLRWGTLPANMPFRYIPGLSLMAGMGFTMSVFIAGLGFGDNPEQLLLAKTGIIFASLLAGLSGFLWLFLQSGSDRKT